MWLGNKKLLYGPTIELPSDTTVPEAIVAARRLGLEIRWWSEDGKKVQLYTARESE
jgi:hypothetical protein